MEVGTGALRERVTIGELIERLGFDPEDDSPVYRRDAEERLARCGIKSTSVEQGTGRMEMIAIARKNRFLTDEVFRDKPWAHSYTDRFRDLPGTRNGGQLRFAGTRHSTVLVPRRIFVED